MRSLVQFIYRFHIGLIFLLLQGICIYFLFQHNKFHKSIFVNSSRTISGQLYEQRDLLSDYLRLNEINDTLAWENAQLKNREISSFVDLQNNLALINDTLMKRKFLFTSAKVINNSVNKRNNYITLNKGLKHGIDQNMAVMYDNKAVGIVRYVSDHFAVVIPLLNTKLQLGVKHARSGEIGVFQWDGNSPQKAQINDVAKYTVVQPGDSIVTTGFSTFFPEGVLVGRVAEVINDPGHDFIELIVDLAIDFERLDYVDVVENLMRQEQKDLETLMSEEE